MGMDAVQLTLPYQIVQANYNATMPPVCHTDYRRIEDATSTMPTNYRYYQPLDHAFVNCCNTYGCLSHENKLYGGGVQPTPYCATLPAYAARVPTGRLIELDAAPMTLAGHYSDKTHAPRKSAMPHRISDLDEVDFYRRQQLSSDGDQYGDQYGGKAVDRKVASRSNSSVSRTRSDDYDTWDFVYRNLESQNYSKDLGEREDVLQHRKELDTRASKHRTLRTQQAENEDKYSAHKFEKRRGGRIDTNEIDYPETNGRNHHDSLSFKKKSSSFDLSDSNRYNSGSAIVDAHLACNRDKRHNSQTLPIPRTHRSSDQIVKIADSLKNIEIARVSKEETEREAKEKKGGEEEGSKKRWNCGTCTYLNTPDKDICEMCGKSRYKGNEDKPLASGGKECPQCTLVNEKDVSICDACQASLKDSPTYI